MPLSTVNILSNQIKFIFYLFERSSTSERAGNLTKNTLEKVKNHKFAKNFFNANFNDTELANFSDKLKKILRNLTNLVKTVKFHLLNNEIQIRND